MAVITHNNPELNWDKSKLVAGAASPLNLPHDEVSKGKLVAGATSPLNLLFNAFDLTNSYISAKP